LVNALAGYQRSVVSDVAGTTRDVVTTSVAFDGWPIELADTAGLRRAAESLEAAGVELARRFTKNADVLVWVIDATNPIWPNPADRTPDLLVVNKSDIAPASISASHSNLLYVSARTGVGLGELVEVITRKIVPTSPTPGIAVPYTADLANTIDAALVALHAGNLADTHSLLKSCLTLTA
jgi:tRNA modification GTPase